MSFDFDEAYYLKSKLAQLKATDAATYGNWNTDQVKQAILDAGFASVEDHCNQYSLVEGTSPNPYFNTMEYLEAKVNQLNSMKEGNRTDWTVEDVVKAFQDAGFTNAEDHYKMYGCKETDANGNLINPSNAFDANAYAAAKLAQLQATDPENWNGKTAQDVMEAIADAGMTPIEHFEEYGKAEGEAADIAMVQTVPVVQRVANDQLRDAMNENVPSNYNAATPAPKNVTTGTEVAKECDMGNEDTVKPADPVATPADVDYMAVPANGIADSNDKPVELVTASTQDAKGNEVTASQYGVTETAEDGSQTTKAVGTDGKVADDAATIKTVSADGKTTTTDVKQGSTEIKQTEVKDGNTTTTTTEASLNGGANTVEQTAVKTGNTTETETTVKNANGQTVSHTEATTKGATTDATTTTYDPSTGKVVETATTKTTETTAADGTKTTTTTGTAKDAQGNETTINKTETVSTAADGSQTTKVSETVKDADGNVVSATETTTEASRAADGTLTSETKGTTTDADGNVTTVNETTTSKTNPTTGATTETKTVDNSTVDKDGNAAGSEKGAVTSNTDADGNATKTTNMTTTDADGNTTQTQSTATYDAEKGTTTTETKTTTTDSDGKTTTETTTETAKGDSASAATTPAEDAQASADSGNSGGESGGESGSGSSGGGSTPPATGITMSSAAFSDGTHLVVTFNKEIDSATANKFTVTKSDGSTTVPVSSAKIDTEDAKKVILELGSSAHDAVTVTLAVGAVADSESNQNSADATGKEAAIYAAKIESVKATGLDTFTITFDDTVVLEDNAKDNVSATQTSDLTLDATTPVTVSTDTLTVKLSAAATAGTDAVSVTLKNGTITSQSGDLAAVKFWLAKSDAPQDITFTNGTTETAYLDGATTQVNKVTLNSTADGDSVTGFTAGTTNGDQLDVTAFLTGFKAATSILSNGTDYSSGPISATAAATGQLALSGKLIVYDASSDSNLEAFEGKLKNSSTTDGDYTLASGEKCVVLAKTANDSMDVYFITGGNGDDAESVVKVATVGCTVADLEGGNFVDSQ